MKIGIDARFVGPQGTGLGKYTEKLILNLARLDSKNQYSIFLKENNWSYLKLTGFKNFTKILADVAWYSLEEQYKMPGIFHSQNLDLLHVPHFNVPLLYKGKFVVTIHDLIHHKFAEYAATTKNPLIFKAKRFAYRKVIENAVKKSQKIISPSKSVKEEIAAIFNVPLDKIAVTYEAAEEEYFPKNSKFTKSGSFLLYVGNAYPHKNLSKLLDALKYSGKTRLVLVCPRDIFWERLKNQIDKRNLKNYVEMKGYLEPEQLSKLFHQASAYVSPSLSEGFGIPGLNALASGLPLLSSNIPVLKEVYGPAALYFDPQNPKDIAAKINKVLADQNTREKMIKAGNKQVNKYSWRKMAAQTLNVYESAVN
jgi:glycosyltransferase involved in cell wall biosynthesis